MSVLPHPPFLTVLDRVFDLAQQSNLSKQNSIVKGILLSIEEQIVKRGDALPSVNSLSQKLGFARQTVVSAYKELKDRGIIISRNRKGYFVASESTEQVMSVALVLYSFHSFQEGFYNTFRSSLGDGIKVDVFFHHNNLDVLEDSIMKISGQYGFYVVAPIDDPKMANILGSLPSSSVLIIDRPPPSGNSLPFISQLFEEPTYNILEGLLSDVKKYTGIKLFYRSESDFPKGIARGVQRFAKANKVALEILSSYLPGSVEKGYLYVTISDTDLWGLLEDCIEQKYVLGEDIGVLSHNDSTIKKMICGGISTISTDFDQMAQRAADYVLSRCELHAFEPTVLIDRQSF